MSLISSQEDSESRPKIRISIVDDNEVFLQAVTEFLQRQPECEVVGAVCEYAQAIIQAQHLEPQIILVGLDGIGLGAIVHLREALPDVGIVALTLVEGDAYQQAVVDAGADDLVCKAAVVTGLSLVIQKVMYSS